MSKNRYRVAIAVVVEVDAASESEAQMWAQMALGLWNSRGRRYHDDLCRTVPFTSAATGEHVVANAVALHADTVMVAEVESGRETPYGYAGEQWSDS